MSLSLLNSSPSCLGALDSQHFHHIFPTTLLHHQCNILYATVLQQSSLITDLERQSLYEEDDSTQSLIHVFHHLYSTQIYLGSFEPRTDHVTSSILHIASVLDDVLDLLHDHGFHHHVVALLPHNLTLARVFQSIYHTLSAMEQDAYEESDLEVSRESVMCDVCDLNGQCLATLHSAASIGAAVSPEPRVFPFEVA